MLTERVSDQGRAKLAQIGARRHRVLLMVNVLGVDDNRRGPQSLLGIGLGRHHDVHPKAASK